MTSTHTRAGSSASWSPAGVFARIVCGVDGSEEGFDAVRQAARLANPSGRVTVSSIWNAGAAVALGWSPPAAYAPMRTREAAEEAVAAARKLLADGLEVETSVAQGPPAPMMTIEAKRHDATLIAIGAHRHGRLPGILLGSVATHLLHNATCPVLIARPARSANGFPRSIIVATDGSVEASRAVAVGETLASRHGAELEAVVAAGEGEAAEDFGRRELRGPGGRRIALHHLRGPVAKALSELRPELLIIGSRGLSGLRSLGSVSERVAHESAASVLVVR